MQLWLNIYLTKVFPSDTIQRPTAQCRAAKNMVTSNNTTQYSATQPLTNIKYLLVDYQIGPMVEQFLCVLSIPVWTEQRP